MTERIDLLVPTLFLDGPVEYLIKSVVAEIKKVPQFAKLFADSVDPYKRLDYSIRGLPALRIYNDISNKEQESHYITGEVMIDVIFPPSQRRDELQQVQDTVTAALTQQFRRPTFFATLGELVPGLNELGKTLYADKSLGFEWGNDIVPLTQIKVNFRIDLKAWDAYLESSCRTKDEPFTKTLANLESIVTVIEGMRDDLETVDVSVDIQQEV